MGQRREVAVLLAALLYSILEQLALSPVLDRTARALSVQPSVLRILSGAVGILGCYAIIVRIVLVLQRWPLRGRWVLTSDSGEFGVASFPVSGGGITYVADLYETAEEVEAALRRQPGATVRCFARLRSISVERSDDGFTVVYEIRRTAPGYPERKGIIDLASAARTSELRGFWSSTADGGANRGGVTFMRPSAFLASRSAEA